LGAETLGATVAFGGITGALFTLGVHIPIAHFSTVIGGVLAIGLGSVAPHTCMPSCCNLIGYFNPCFAAQLATFILALLALLVITSSHLEYKNLAILLVTLGLEKNFFHNVNGIAVIGSAIVIHHNI